jgi:threonine aldolase
MDFRSDTVTRPSEEMRRAMAEAVVGDDVLGDDPTVKELEAAFAERVGKEAAMFVPSGTMANVCAILTHCRPGDEAVMEEGTHSFRYEGGAAARLGGIQVWTFVRENGVPEIEDFQTRIRNGSDPHQPRTALLIVENTHNLAGGRVVPKRRMDEIAEFAHERGIQVHVDGARLFNAEVASGVPTAELVASADSLMCCLSKGLGAPIGSLLAGEEAFIQEARRARKALGGGMRQSGILAAAGLIALREGPAALAADHARAKKLAEVLAELPGFVIDPKEVETNMVYVGLKGLSGPAVVEACGKQGLLVLAVREDRLRFVLHRDIDDKGLDRAIDILRELAKDPSLKRSSESKKQSDDATWEPS